MPKEPLALIPAGMEDLFEISHLGFKVKEGAMPSYAQWAKAGRFVAAAGRSLGFVIGDWINSGQQLFGERYKKALVDTNFDYGTLRKYASVAKNVPLLLRNNNLPFEHHAAVAPLEESEQKRWLELCDEKIKAGDYVGQRRLRRSIEAGALVPENKIASSDADRGIPSHIQQINRLRQWMREMVKSGRIGKDMPEADKEALRLDFSFFDKEVRLVLLEYGCYPSQEFAATAFSVVGQ